MKDWSLVAKARGLDIPPAELTRLSPTLDALDQAFRPLAQKLTPEMEPAPVFRMAEENS